MNGRYIAIQSNNRDRTYENDGNAVLQDTSTPSSFRLNLETEIPANSRIIVQSFTMPNTFYNIYAANCKMLYGASSANLTHGSYTLTELLAAVGTAYTTLTGVVCSFAHSSITNKVTMTVASAITFVGSVSYTSNDSIFHNVLGFTNRTGESVTTTLASGACPALMGDTNIYVNINEFSSLFYRTSAFKPTFSFINNADRGYLITYTRNEHPLEAICHNGTRSLTVSAHNEDGSLVQGLSDWEIVLEVVPK